MEPSVGLEELLAQRVFLRRLARSLLGEEALAEDVVAEAELRALRCAPGSPASLRAWLVTVTRRLALNARRARERRASHERVGARPEALPGPDEALAGLELQRIVLAAVDGLDEPQRTAIWQRYYEDRSPAEIAARLGLPVATVKTRLRRALAELRADLDRRHGGRREAWAVGLGALAPRGSSSTLPLTLGGLGMKKLACAIGLGMLAWLGWRSLTAEAPGAMGTTSAVPAALAAAPDVGAAGSPVHEPVREAVRPPPLEAPAEASELTSLASLSVHATWTEDGSDAAGIGLTLWPEDEDRPDLRARLVETDSLGIARFDALTPGRHVLRSDRGTETPLDLAAGEHTHALELPVGLDVLGRVVDGEEEPVPGAEVWLEGWGGGPWGGRVVTRACSDGTFRLRGLQRELSLAAYAPGFAPSALARMMARTQEGGEREVRVTLVLARAGAVVSGRVLDALGRPAEGALVALGTSGNRARDEDWSPRARTLATDADGRFAFGWITPRPERLLVFDLHVLAEGHALAFVPEDEVRAALGGELVVHLSSGVAIQGRVTDQAGHALAGVHVEVRHDPKEVETTSPFQLPRARTAADGSFTLAHVPAGDVRLAARLEADRGLGAEEERFVAENTRERWDLVLGPARVIRGRVVDGDGNGLAGRTVLCMSDGGGTAIESDSTGRFLFAPTIRGEEWNLALLGPGGVVDQHEGLRFGAEVVLVDRPHGGRVLGGFSDRAGLAREGQQLLASLSADDDKIHMSLQAAVDAQGAFAFEGVRPGRYRVTIQSGEHEIAESAWFDLAEGVTVTLDWLESGTATPDDGG